MTEITIRRSMEADSYELFRLAALDSRPAIEGDALLAFVDGELRAAMGFTDDRVVADPFELTGDIEKLLRMRVAQEHDPRRAGSSAGWRSRLAPAWGRGASA